MIVRLPATVLLLVVLVLGAAQVRADVVAIAGEDLRPEIVLWHAYRADEAVVIEEIVAGINASEIAFRVKVLAVPYDAYLDKIGAAIPRGRGPDLFIAAHDPIGDWAEANTIQPIDDVVDAQTASSLVPGLLPAVVYRGHVYGLPIAFKSVALWRNPRRVPVAPTTLDGLLRIAAEQTNAAEGRYGFVYENRDLYFHAPLLFGYGGRLFDDDGHATLDDPHNVASIEAAQRISASKVVPQEVSGTLTMSLFNEDKAAMIVTGPWSRGEISDGVVFEVSALPDVVGVDGVTRPMKPLLTVEALFLSGRLDAADPVSALRRSLAVRLARLLSDESHSVLRLKKGRQPVALQKAWDSLGDDDDARVLRGFRAQLDTSVPTPNSPAMKALWSPFNLALGESIGQGAAPSTTLGQAQVKVKGEMAVVEQRSTEGSGQGAFVVVVVVLLLLAVFWALRSLRTAGGLAVAVRAVRANGVAYAYVAPAMTATALLVFFPFVVGVGMGFFRHTWGVYTFVGMENFISILTGADSTFLRTLGVTVLWTASNIVLHVSIGVVLALVLSQARLRFRTIYRVLFVIPWAVPSYITALIWKGMFHPEFGAVNALLGLQGFSWMNSFWSAFTANLITNAWLGFPFMMVTALGGLTSIPKDLYEAAALDGASAFQRFTSITLPLLRPTMAPAIVLGTVWTFNMFNVIYLVSGGAPGGKTDILVTEAFRWAFERGQGGAFGIAAAYSTLIFLMLLSYNIAAARVTRGVEGRP